MGLSAAAAGTEIGGSLLGGIKGSQAQSNDNSALNSLVGADIGNINDLQGLVGQISNLVFGPNGTEQGINSLIQQFQNYQGLTPAQINELTSSTEAGGQSAINTFKTEAGGVANPALLVKQLLTQNQQQGAQEGVALGSQVAEAKLQGLEGAGSLLSGQQGLLGEGLSGLSGAGSSLQALASLYANAATAQGNPWGSAFQGISGALTTLGANNNPSPFS